MIVFLARYGRIDPRYAEEQDLDRLSGLARLTSDWIAAENGKRDGQPVEDISDDAGDFA